jgi:hypothetical protein
MESQPAQRAHAVWVCVKGRNCLLYSGARGTSAGRHSMSKWAGRRQDDRHSCFAAKLPRSPTNGALIIRTNYGQGSSAVARSCGMSSLHEMGKWKAVRSEEPISNAR